MNIEVDSFPKWFFIWVIFIVGEPDIIDGIVSVLQSLSEWLLR